MESFRETFHEGFSSENSEGIKFPLEIKFGLEIETKERSLYNIKRYYIHYINR
jgi:hypothetical protein